MPTFFLSNINNILNNYLYHYIIILFLFYGNFTAISNITFFLSPILFFRDCLSSNNRSLIIFSKKKKLIDVFFFKRFLYSFTILLLYILFKEYILDIKSQKLDLLIYSTALIILILWLNEIVISFNEINKNFALQKIQLFLLTFLYVLIFLFFFLGVNIYTLIVINLLTFLVFFKNFNLKNYLKSKLIFDFKNFVDTNLFSTFALSFVSLTWRIVIFLYLDNELAGILFVIFAFATFPSTLLNNNIGASLENLYFKNKLFFRYLVFLFFTALYCVVLSSIYLFYIAKTGDSELSSFYLKTTFFSYFGSVLMMIGISKRISNLSKNKNKTYKIDIIYSVINLSLIFLVILISSTVNTFYLLTFFSGLFSLIYYKFDYDKKIQTRIS